MNDIGQRIKDLRETSHLSQAELSKICGISQATIAKTEAGKTPPSIKLLLNLADYFDISMDYLTCRTDQPQGRLYECKPKINISQNDMKQFIEMCFDPRSPFNSKLRQTLFDMMEDTTE